MCVIIFKIKLAKKNKIKLALISGCQFVETLIFVQWLN